MSIALLIIFVAVTDIVQTYMINDLFKEIDELESIQRAQDIRITSLEYEIMQIKDGLLERKYGK